MNNKRGKFLENWYKYVREIKLWFFVKKMYYWCIHHFKIVHLSTSMATNFNILLNCSCNIPWTWLKSKVVTCFGVKYKGSIFKLVFNQILALLKVLWTGVSDYQTALLWASKNIYLLAEECCCFILALDLCAVFDTVEHNILMTYLHYFTGIGPWVV